MDAMTNPAIPEDTIRMRSYLIWEREGRPGGRHLEHWLQATQELRVEATTEPDAEVAGADASVSAADRRRPPAQKL